MHIKPNFVWDPCFIFWDRGWVGGVGFLCRGSYIIGALGYPVERAIEGRLRNPLTTCLCSVQA